MIGGAVDYWNKTTQQDIEDMQSALESSKYFREDVYTQSWLRNFLSFVQRRNDLRSLKDTYIDLSDKTSFVHSLQTVTNIAGLKDIDLNYQMLYFGFSVLEI